MTHGGLLVVALAAARLAATDPVARDTVTVEPRPPLEIGASSDDARDQLFDVVDVARTADGGLLVAERSAGRVRVYDARGAWVRDLGGRGGGPGEFTEILDVAPDGRDALWVLDGDGRVTRLGLEGEVTATWRLDVAGLTDEAFNPVPSGVLGDGRAMVRAAERVFGRPDGEYVQRVGFLAVDARGEVDTLAFVASHRVRSEDGIPRPYRPWTEADWAAGGGIVWLTSPADGRVLRVGAGARAGDGSVEEGADARVVVVGRRRAPAPADLARFRERYVRRGRTDNDRRVIAEWVDGSPVAETLPPFRRVEADALGRVWIEGWAGPDEGTSWTVHDRDGALLCHVRLASRLRLEDAGADWIVGLWRDSFDVERVRVHRWEGCRA